MFQKHGGNTPSTYPDAAAGRATVGTALQTMEVPEPEVYAALATLTAVIGRHVNDYGAIKAIAAAATPNVRNDMPLASEAGASDGCQPGSRLRQGGHGPLKLAAILPR